YSCWNHEKGVCLPGDSFGCAPETGRAQNGYQSQQAVARGHHITERERVCVRA
ncbi:hypothetical protein KUCAC02_003537, partial [Chaenocephalus aceratus]